MKFKILFFFLTLCIPLPILKHVQERKQLQDLSPSLENEANNFKKEGGKKNRFRDPKRQKT